MYLGNFSPFGSRRVITDDLKLVKTIIIDTNIISKKFRLSYWHLPPPSNYALFIIKSDFHSYINTEKIKVAFCVGNAGRIHMFISNNKVYSSLLSAVCLLKIWSRDSNSWKDYEIFFFPKRPEPL